MTAAALAIAAAIAAILALHQLAWLLLRSGAALLRWTPARRQAARAWTWAQRHPWRGAFAARCPRLYAILAVRLEPKAFHGLPLTLIAAAALYLAALFGGLIDDLFEREGLVRFDAPVQSGLEAWRAGPLRPVFLWLTALGAGPALVAVALVATGFLWAQHRRAVIAPLWITFLGAQLTTWLGKIVIDRERPHVTDAVLHVLTTSPSFPSGHTTGAAAVYGFVAYAIARDRPTARVRFELGFWTCVLVAAIGFSRIFLGVHYVSDVASGFVVDGFWLLVGFAIAERARARAGAAAAER